VGVAVVVVVVLLLAVGVFADELEAAELLYLFQLGVEDGFRAVNSHGQSLGPLDVLQQAGLRSGAAALLKPQLVLPLQLRHVVGGNLYDLLRSATVVAAVYVLQTLHALERFVELDDVVAAHELVLE